MHGGYAKNIGAGASKVVLHDLGSLTVCIDNHYIFLHRILLSAQHWRWEGFGINYLIVDMISNLFVFCFIIGGIRHFR